MDQTQSNLGKILIIEDDPVSRKLVSGLLKRAGHQIVWEAETGEQALSICEANDVDVILLDLMLPDMSGETVFTRLQEIYPSVPVIVLTATNSVANSVKMMKLGVFNYLTKPIDEQGLLSQVEDALAYRQLYQPVAADTLNDERDNIIVVGKNHQNATTLKRCLGEFYQVLAFDNLESLQAERPVPGALVVIADLDNREMLAELDSMKFYSTSSELLVIAPGDNKALIHDALANGATGFLPHPLNENVVVQKLEQIRNIFYSERPYNHPYYAEFTQLQTSVLKSASSDKCHTILVASPEPGDGRTFIAANLARNIARNSDNSVLLLDFDRRQPTLHREFALPKNRGLTEVMGSVISLEEAIYTAEYPNLHIMPAGLHRVQLNHMLTRSNVSRLLKQLQQRYSVIVIDSSPLNVTNKENIDPITIADLVDAVYFVVAPRKTRKHMLHRTVEHFQANAREITGFVINNHHVPHRDDMATRLLKLRTRLLKRAPTGRLFIRGTNGSINTR